MKLSVNLWKDPSFPNAKYGTNSILEENHQNINNFPNQSSVDPRLSDLIASNESVTKKMILLTDQVKDIIKSLCVHCGFSQTTASNDASLNLCSICNSIFCPDCIKEVSCIKCHRKVCEEHCIKCQICNRRSCKDKGCIFDFRICQTCEYTYCQEHFDAHKKLNQVEPYKINCSCVKINNAQELTLKGFLEFTSIIVNACRLKELKIRKILKRK